MTLNKITLIISSFIAPFICNSQSDLYNAGGSSLTFYIGQNHTVQAEGNITNAASATIQFENGGTPDLRLRGNFTNSVTGVYTLGTEKVRFNGSSLQLADFGGDDIYGIYTDNSNNIQIDRNVTVTGDVEFDTGDLISTTSSYVTVGTSGTVTNADDDSHNFGPIAKNFDSTSEFEYPVGDGSTYRMSTFTPDGASAVTVRSAYYNAKYPDVSTTPAIYKVSQLEYWDMYRTSGTTTGAVKLSWDANSSVLDYLDLTVGYYDGTDWDDAGAAAHTGNNTAGTVISNASWNTYNTFFTLATTTADNPLPVELLNFEVKEVDDFIEILWETSAEINSDYFSVLKSTDGLNFKEIAQINAAGQSSQLISYNTLDNEPTNGANYYKLVNYDFDGTFQESEVKLLYFSGENQNEFSASVYPNPISSEANFDLKASEEGEHTIRLFNINGAMIYSSKVLTTKGFNSFQINMDIFISGKYLVQITSPTGELITKSIRKF